MFPYRAPRQSITWPQADIQKIGEAVYTAMGQYPTAPSMR
jgi:hypothetical protein